jgi:Phage integrase family
VIDALTDDELRDLFGACRGKRFTERRDEAIVRLMAETGARAGEIVAMQVSDVDLTRGLAVVRRGKGGKGGKDGKDGKGGVVPFGAQTVAAIDRYLRVRHTHRLADGDQLWLGADDWRPFSYFGLRHALQRRAELTGIKDFHPHKLRHTTATRWLRAGGSEGALMAVAGWSTRGMIDRYTGASAGATRWTNHSTRSSIPSRCCSQPVEPVAHHRGSVAVRRDPQVARRGGVPPKPLGCRNRGHRAAAAVTARSGQPGDDAVRKRMLRLGERERNRPLQHTRLDQLDDRLAAIHDLRRHGVGEGLGLDAEYVVKSWDECQRQAGVPDFEPVAAGGVDCSGFPVPLLCREDCEMPTWHGPAAIPTRNQCETEVFDRETRDGVAAIGNRHRDRDQ